MKTECPGKLEIFSTWLFTEYVCQPQSRVKKQNKPALSFAHDLPLKGWVLWGCPYQVKWLTLVKDFLCLRVNPHRHLNFCVFHQELTPTPIGTKAVFRCSLASSTRNTRNGVVHIRKGSQDQDAQPHPGLWLCDSAWAQSCLSLPSSPAVGGPCLMFLQVELGGNVSTVPTSDLSLPHWPFLMSPVPCLQVRCRQSSEGP